MKYQWTFLISSLVALMVACGAPPPPPEVFVAENAWKTPIPTDSQIVSPEEFRSRVNSGELRVVSTEGIAAEKAFIQKQYNDDKVLLQGIANKSPALQALLEEAAQQTKADGDRTLQLPDGSNVTLLGLTTQIREAVETYQTSQDAGNALGVYSLSYSLLPANVKALVPTPASMNGKSLTEINAALSNMNQALGTASSGLNTARLEPRSIAPSSGQLQTQSFASGNGTDNSGACTPTNYVAKYWFPLKNFVSPVKQQGKRGTCWAFTAIGAVESRERVQNNNPADLSEQFLVNKVKEDWDSSKYTDAYQSEKALNLAVDKGQAFPSEGSWTYNPAYGRPDTSKDDENTEKAYVNTCKDYTGMCSDTSHQSRRTCSTFVVTVCAYSTVGFSGSGVTANRTRQIYSSYFFPVIGLPLNLLRALLSQGHTIMASFPVYTGFSNVGKDGIVGNYATTGYEGGHAVQIVGFLSNSELSTAGQKVNVGGGGYFIVKNSWGCNKGDGGYYYIPADYVAGYFYRLSVLEFDSRRSSQWNSAQQNPGGAPTINTANITANLRASKDLADSFTIRHPYAKQVSLTVTSDKDGKLFEGGWNTQNATVLARQTLPVVFTSLGVRTISLVAKNAAFEARASFTVSVFNSNPNIRLLYNGNPNQGENFVLNAIISDDNEPEGTTLCANATWSVSAPDTLNTNTGCLVQVKFGTTGSRQVSVVTRDSEGLPSPVKVETFQVSPPLANPYPRILASGVYSREVSGICRDIAVSSGNRIDLRESGCGGAAQRFSAQVQVENPSGENLTYDWKLFVPNIDSESVLIGGNTSTLPLSFNNNGEVYTVPCRVELTVGAPDPSRSKTQTVWIGSCTYRNFGPN